MLIIKKGPTHVTERDEFRRYSQASSLRGNDRVRFTYMYEDTQTDFVKALMSKGRQGEEADTLKVGSGGIFTWLW